MADKDENKLFQLVTNGDPTALSLIKTFLDLPMLINTGKVEGGGITKGWSQGLPFAIPLETETHQQTGSAQVSESLVIIANGKRNVCDNVAPGAWTWNLTGYIPGNAFLEKTNLFTPFVQMHTQLLRNAYKNGYILIFKDIDCQIYKRVVIQNLTISQVKDVRNKMPFTMTLKEINVVDDVLGEMTDAESKSSASVGSVLGKAAVMGSTIAAAALVSHITQSVALDND